MPETPFRKSNILHVCKVFLPEKGGIQVVVDWICNGLSEHFEFSILTTSTRPAIQKFGYAEIDRVRSYGDLNSLPIAPMLIFKLWRKIRKKELIAIHYPFPLADVALALYPFKLPKLVVFWHSEIVSQKVSSWAVLPFTKLMLARADAVVCASPNMIEHSRLLVKHKAKCKVIPYGVPQSKLLVPETKILAPSESNTFLTIARHVPYKGLHILIEAFSKVPTPFKLIIVGAGPLFESHLKLVDDLGLTEKVSFLTSASNNEVDELLMNCRTLVLPSVFPSEAFGLVQIEAMQYGRPVINTNLPSGVPWVARDKKEAITVEPGDSDSLAHALIKMTNDEVVNLLGTNAAIRAHSEFDHQKFCDQILNLLQSLLLEKQ